MILQFCTIMAFFISFARTIPLDPKFSNMSATQQFEAEEKALWTPMEEPMTGDKIMVKPINASKIKKRTNKKRRGKKIKTSTAAPEMSTTIQVALKHGPNGRKSYMEYLMEKNAKFLQTSTTIEPDIYDTVNNIVYKQDDLRQMCKQSRQLADNFGIRDVSSFAENHCPLIRIYYPDVSCEQIRMFLKYCDSIKTIQ